MYKFPLTLKFLKTGVHSVEIDSRTVVLTKRPYGGCWMEVGNGILYVSLPPLPEQITSCDFDRAAALGHILQGMADDTVSGV